MAWAQVKKKPYAAYDLCPRPMAWAQVINTIIIPLLRHFTMFGQENAQNMRR